ncbi:MAG: ATP-binding protein [Burkholderiaceae bacterium]
MSNQRTTDDATARGPAWSLRRRMVWIAAAALFASLVSGALAMHWASRLEEDQAMDARLEHLGAVMIAFVEDEVAEELLEATHGLHAMPLNMKTRAAVSALYRFQVWTPHGSLLLRSRETPADQPLMPLTRLGYADARIADEPHRVFSLPTRNGEFIVQVAENVTARWTQRGTLTLAYALFLALPLALVFTLAGLWLRRSLRSIDELAGQLGERRPLDLSPLRVTSPPQEMLPILRSIDGLIGRVAHALSVERAFTSMAAHEMRTPLAGLRASAQVARRASQPDTRDEALRAVVAGADRAAHLLDQLLDLARVDSTPKDAEPMLEAVDLAALHAELWSELEARAARKQLHLTTRFDAPTLRGHRFALHTLLRNLLVNAIDYTPEGGRVEVSTHHAGGALVLTVDDSGPGIRPEDRARAFERFNRLGLRQAGGVGLGLSIALSVVELHRARLELHDSPLGGLRARVVFDGASTP